MSRNGIGKVDSRDRKAEPFLTLQNSVLDTSLSIFNVVGGAGNWRLMGDGEAVRSHNTSPD
jgi:hypothetical protein